MKQLRFAVKFAFAATLIAAGALKLGSGEAVVIEGVRMLDVGDADWTVVWRLLHAVAVAEIALGSLMLVTGPARWWLLLATVLGGFIAWDFGRYWTGGLPDCGCFGAVQLASEWWHVVIKHVALLLGFGCVVSGRWRSRRA